MLVIAILVVASDLASTAPALPSTTTGFDAVTPVTTLGREIRDCVNVAHFRTMQGITWSCLATIFACTWVAVHPNVPYPQDSGWVKFKQRLRAMVYAILTPEFVILWAWRQRRGAVAHMKQYNEKFHQGVTPPSRSIWWYWFHHPRNEKPDGLWTMTHGFLLEMHGLMHGSGEVCSIDDIPVPLDIPEEDINDKSKGDLLTKTLVVAQTTWFIFQCTARWATHLPVTKLEVITFAFALLNIGTYTLWWNKPQNMGVAIQMDRYRRPQGTSEQKETTGGEQDGASNLLRPELLLEDHSDQRSGFLSRASAVMEQWVWRMEFLMKVVITFLRPPYFRTLILVVLYCFFTVPLDPLANMIGCRLSGKDNDSTRTFYSSTKGHNTPMSWTLVIGGVFGGLHLIPLWVSSFPSSAEKLLWKLSAIWVTIQPFLLLSLRVALKGRSKATFVLCFTWGTFALYVIARTILVVLAFTTLRQLPSDVFRNVAWTTFLPHL